MSEGMVTNGSKLLIGATTVALIAAIAYGVLAEGTLGVFGLLFAASALALLAGINIAIGDGDVDPDDTTAVAASTAARPAPTPSVWPLAVGLGGGVMVLGLVTEPVVFALGVVLVFAGLAEWLIDAWSEGASSEVAYNREARARMAGPLEFPILGTVIAVVVIFSFSRIMLFLSVTGGVVVFAVIATVVLLSGFAIAYRPRLGSTAIGALCVVGALGLVAGGVVTGLEGERDIEVHEHPGILAAHSECSTPEETHADERASQTVAAKANLTATVVLTSDERLVAEVPGTDDERTTIVVPRGAPSNILFRNRSSEDRRLTLDLGLVPAVDDEGEEIEGEDRPVQQCTALVEDGGAQLLTVRISRTSALVDDPYVFTVPGVEGQEIEVVVP